MRRNGLKIWLIVIESGQRMNDLQRLGIEVKMKILPNNPLFQAPLYPA